MKKCVIVGVTSSIAAYKSVQLVSDLLKKNIDVEVIMSKNATEFIQPLTFSTLTKHKTYVDTFDRNVNYDVEHISLAKKADAFIIAPASANVIAKVAHGICDDMLTTTFLACNCPKIIAPAMNTNMYENPITQDNFAICKKYGMHIVEAEAGLLACGDNGKGKLASIPTLMEAVEMALEKEKPLLGKKVLITAGPTQEAMDPVRYITNHSSGKMGYNIAKAARNMGAEVTLLSGPVSLAKPYGVNVVNITTTNDLLEAAKRHFETCDYVFAAAAPADYRPLSYNEQKIKKMDGDMHVALTRNPDVLKYMGEHKTHQKICGFAAESENVIENGRDKLLRKNCDMLVANNITAKDAGFKSDNNRVTILTKDKDTDLELMSKEDLAKIIVKTLCEC